MEVKQSLQMIQETMVKNENEMKDRLCQLDNTMKLRAKNLENENRELKTANERMQEDISKLSSQMKKLQEQISSIKKKNKNLAEQQETTTNQLKALSQNQSKECHDADKAAASQQLVSVEPPEERETSLNQASPIISTIPLQNAFEVLQDEREGNSQVIEVETKQESAQSEHKQAQQQQQRRKPETAPNGQSRVSSNEIGDTVILCDSNGKYLKLKRLCPDRKVTYFRCPTVQRGKEIIQSSDFGTPQTILIHTGTNDLEREISTSQSTSDLTTLITTAAEKYLTSKVLYSTLLPRRDIDNEEILKINTLIEKKCSRLPNVHLIDHTNLFQHNNYILHDAKHLNPYGVKLFAKNLKDIIYGRKQTAQYQASGRPRRFSPQINIRDDSYMEIRQEQDKSRSSYAAALQRSPLLMLHPTAYPAAHTAAHPTAHPTAHPAALPTAHPAQFSAAYPTAHPPPPPPPPTTGTTTAPTIQQHMEQQGHMNISIPNKMFPLIQFFNSLI